MSKSSLSSCTRVMPDSSIKKRPQMGAKQAFVMPSANHTVKITESLRKDKNPECSKRKVSEAHRASKPHTSSSSAGTPVDAGIQTSAQRHNSGFPAKTFTRNSQTEENRKLGTSHKSSKLNFSSPNSHSSDKNKTAHKRRPVAVSDDINNLFTPDPTTFLIVDGQKVVKSTFAKETSKPSERNKLSVSVPSSSSTGSPCHKSPNVTHAAIRKGLSLSSEHQIQISLPTICLEQIKITSKGFKLANSPSNILGDNIPEVTPSRKMLQDDSIKSDRKPASTDGRRPCMFKNENSAPQKMLTSPSSQSRANNRERKKVTEQDPLEVELDLGLSFSLDLDLSQSSLSSEEEEELMTLQELMEDPAHPDPDTPKTGTFSEPSTPEQQSSKPNTVSAFSLLRSSLCICLPVACL